MAVRAARIAAKTPMRMRVQLPSGKGMRARRQRSAFLGDM
jgi:hypothetical protein